MPNPNNEEILNHTGGKKICPICKKHFHCAAARWGWKIGDRLYCSYRCMRVEEKARQEERKLRDKVDDLTHDAFGRPEDSGRNLRGDDKAPHEPGKDSAGAGELCDAGDGSECVVIA